MFLDNCLINVLKSVELSDLLLFLLNFMQQTWWLCRHAQKHTRARSHLLSPFLSLLLNCFYSLGLAHFFRPLCSPTLTSFRLNKCNLAGKELWIQTLSLPHSLILHYSSCTPFSPPLLTFAPPPSLSVATIRALQHLSPLSFNNTHSSPLPTMKVESCSSSLVKTLLAFRGWPLLNRCTILITLLSSLV